MGDIRIRVGAAADASLRDVFRPIEDAAKRSRKVAAGEMANLGKETGANAKKGADAAERAFAKLAKEAARWKREEAREADRAERDKTRSVERESAKQAAAAEKLARTQIASFEKTAREHARMERKMSEQALAEGRRTLRTPRVSGTQANGNRAITPGAVAASRMALNFGGRVAGDLARGVGVDLDLSSHVKQNADLETRAVELSNSGYMAGAKGPNGMRQSSADLIAQTRSVGNATGYSANDAMEGLQAFVGKTGDLQTGRDVLKDMAVLSRATGTNLKDMVDAAADVSMNLGDVEDKGKVTTELMRAFAGMGKEGAVEIKDLSKQMAGLAAMAPQFGGDRADAIAMMGALAQEARQRGGSKSSAQAVTSVGSFVATFSKAARNKEFKAFGVKTQDANGGLRHADDIIVDSLLAASAKDKGGLKGMNENMGKMFMDVRARGAVRGFENIFRDAGGGEAGARAVREEFEKLKNATLGLNEQSDSFKKAMTTGQVQAQQFNNELSVLAGELQTVVTPAMRDLGPVIVSLTKAGIDFVSFVTGSTLVRTSKEGAVANINESNAIGQARESVALLSGAVDGTYVADAQGNQHHVNGSVTKDQYDAANKADKVLQDGIAKREAEVAQYRTNGGFAGDDMVRKTANAPGNNEEQQKARAYLKATEDLAVMKDRQTAVHTAIEGFNNALTGTLNVRIVDTPATPPPKVDPHGLVPGVTPPASAPGRQ